ncbi:hypothetical protein [Runella salmonicolor]|uniref:Lipoprotein n=1 Tax=Runella salmonicolor TaxID=2950278 RepID=A0ABT1FMW1_9BACT|nr:hypothetical protein [Runella salmonicolor]MCP1381903.1 hypothetical protein [Runella salmonicolor]
MKNLRFFFFVIGLAFCCFWLCSCKDPLEIKTKSIYYPVELDETLKPIIVREKDPNRPYPFSTDSILVGYKVRFKSDNILTGFGVFYSYDSLVVSDFIRAREVKGAYQILKATQTSATQDGKKIISSNLINFDKSKGAYFYVVPFAYNKNNESEIFNNGNLSSTYTSKDYMRIQITPWDNLKGPTNNQRSIKLFSRDGILSCAYISNSKLIVSTYDNLKNNWTTTFDMSTKIRKSPITSDSVEVFSINEVEYSKISNSLVLAVKTEGAMVNEGNYNLEIIDINLTDKKYRVKSLLTGTKFKNSIQTYCSFLSESNEFKLMFMSSKGSYSDVSKVFLELQYPSPSPNTYSFSGYISNYSCVYSINNDIKLPTIILYSNQIGEYNIGLKFGQSFITDSFDFDFYPDFSVFNIESNGKINVSHLDITFAYGDLRTYISTFAYGLIPCIAKKDGAYLLISNQFILDLKYINNTIEVSPVFKDWFPGGLPKSISQGVFLNEKIYALVNGIDLWEFDPNKLNIDFSRNGTVKIIDI